MRSRRSAAGFTLIEVLVAFMILTLSLTVLFRIFSGGLGNVTASADYTRAVQIAKSRLAAAGVSDPLFPEVIHGDAEQFHWQRAVEQYVPREESSGLQGSLSAYRVTVDVTWTRDGREKQVTLSSLRLKKTAVIGGAG